jgi:hypothetical protein
MHFGRPPSTTNNIIYHRVGVTNVINPLDIEIWMRGWKKGEVSATWDVGRAVTRCFFASLQTYRGTVP